MEIRERIELIENAVENGSLKIIEVFSPSNDFEGCVVLAEGDQVCESNSVLDALVNASFGIPELYDYILDWIKWEKSILGKK